MPVCLFAGGWSEVVSHSHTNGNLLATWQLPKVGLSRDLPSRTHYLVLFLRETSDASADPAEVDSEIRFLFTTLMGN
jgi:hypothetical protein